MKRMIFIACLSGPLDCGGRKFMWQDESPKVSVLQYATNGRYIGRSRMSASAARGVWKILIRQGWSVKIKKTPAESLGGISVRNEINRLSKLNYRTPR